MPLPTFKYYSVYNASRPTHTKKEDGKGHLPRMNGAGIRKYGSSGKSGTTSSHPWLPNGKAKIGKTNHTGVSAGTTIDDLHHDTVRQWIINERARRNLSTSITSVNAGTTIDDSHFNQLNSALSSSSISSRANDTAYAANQSVTLYTYTTPGPPSNYVNNVAAGTTILASHINGIRNELNSAGAACICNCNYCSCNCNYCTCNCNYKCTCDCNYSDQRLKTDITFVGMVNNLKIYTFKYIWDKITTHRGVMAQELVGTKYENALCKDDKGYYMVDYSKLPI